MLLRKYLLCITLIPYVFKGMENDQSNQQLYDQLFDLLYLEQEQEALEHIKKHQLNPNAQNFFGNTPLHLLVTHKKNYPFVKGLLTLEKIDPNKRALEGKQTPLHRAVLWSQSPRMIYLLIKNKANLDIQDEFGDTPLLKSLKFSVIQKEAAATLIYCGADVNKANHEQVTPLVCALYHKDSNLTNLLLAYGARVPKNLDQKYDPKLLSLRKSTLLEYMRKMSPPEQKSLSRACKKGITIYSKRITQQAHKNFSHSLFNLTLLSYAQTNSPPEVTHVLSETQLADMLKNPRAYYTGQKEEFDQVLYASQLKQLVKSLDPQTISCEDMLEILGNITNDHRYLQGRSSIY